MIVSIINILLLFNHASTWKAVQSFQSALPLSLHPHNRKLANKNLSSMLLLNAQKKQTKKNKSKRAVRTTIGNRTKPTTGFGGGAVEPCPCGSGNGYMKCCGKLHSDPAAYASANAEAVVRARYSAYAKRQINFIIGSTHPLNKDFMTDIEHWKETIDQNCYDNFELTKCKITDETYEGEGDTQTAKVTFVATMIQVDSREKTAFMETSTFERGKHIREGAWMYKSGIVESVPTEDDSSASTKVEDTDAK